MSKRKQHRHTKRLQTTFTCDTESCTGITSDVSENGLFIRTRKGLAPGSLLDIEINLPNGEISKIRGRVIRTVRTQLQAMKNGMGIEIIEKDASYINLVNALQTESDGGFSGEAQKSSEPEFSILACRKCGAKNRVRTVSGSLTPKCGKCKQPLYQTKEEPAAPEHLIISCSNCNAKNKVAREKLSLNPRCGKCGTILKAEGII